MTTPSGSPRPIGYLLKEADRVITAHVDAAQAANGVSRLEWQVLNSLRAGSPGSSAQLAAALHMFLDEAAALGRILERFRAEGWAEVLPTGEVRLTAAGERHHTHVLARQQEVRQLAMQGISSEDYSTVLRVLDRIVTNLEGPRGEPPE
jgi:DNA-binding MarR family transcriptional regulator